MIDYILGKWRVVKQHGRIGTGNAWLLFERGYNEAKSEKKFASIREVNRAWIK
jgi:hypothetical protein